MRRIASMIYQLTKHGQQRTDKKKKKNDLGGWYAKYEEDYNHVFAPIYFNLRNWQKIQSLDKNWQHFDNRTSVSNKTFLIPGTVFAYNKHEIAA